MTPLPVNKKKPKTPKKKSISFLKKKLWELCKQIIRATYIRNGLISCYACGSAIKTLQDAHTAHFVASSISGANLRYDLRNLRICCGSCNVWKSGNFPAFYEKMCEEIGKKQTDLFMLERHKTIKADRFFYENLIEKYQTKLAELSKG